MRKHRVNTWRWGIFLMAILLTPLVLMAATTGQLIGYVQGPDDAPLKGVTVTLRGTNLMGKRTATTDKKGFYRFTQLPSGDGYNLHFEAGGMRAAERTGVHINVDSLVRMPTVKMQKAPTEEAPESIEVPQSEQQQVPPQGG